MGGGGKVRFAKGGLRFQVSGFRGLRVSESGFELGPSLGRCTGHLRRGPS